MTEKAETNVIKEPSLIVPKRLKAHKIVVKSTGKVVEITNDHRIIYGHLEDQFRSLTNPKNIAAGKASGHYYDSDENLAIRNGVSEYIFKKVKKDLKALGLIDWIPPKAKKSGHACEYFVKQLTDIAHNLEFIYQELSNGQPSYDHVRVSGLKTKKTKKAAQPKNEEKKGNGEQAQQQEYEQQSLGVSPTAIYSESKPVQRADDVASSSATDDPEQQSGVSQFAGDSCDDVSANDAVSSNREIAPLSDLLHWQNDGQDGLAEYLAMWGKPMREAQALIKSHITILHSQGNKGSRSAANDEPSGADAIYKQQQARRTAAAKQANNAPQQQEDNSYEYDESIPF